MNPEVSFTLIDSVQKKMTAVQEFADQLGLKNVTTLSDRLELIGRDSKYRERFDHIVSRALAPLPTLLELAIPLLDREGEFIAMKGPGYLEEVHLADRAMEILNVTQPTVERYELKELGYRYLLRFKKTKGVPHLYPRRVGVPKKAPL
ncbi:class I SAM-dependent methyltransferase [Candidatus Peregrinibacteria bacterium]|nr:MAG: class I SAM-dependent methyltransferase [Candidatus Peregrinibacteria bacterium]